ncbi:hypothetical protein [Marinomonas sp. 2405UD68-3]|uniref:hypothetical protein n=1 Tax=Marinomonas sp. 2405UD68-3 TaxID=3391835 RepID=UPI0039C9C547
MKSKVLFHLALIGFLAVNGSLLSANEVKKEKNLPNFEAGISAGLLSAEQLYGLDVTINMPITHILTTQFLINSDYLVANRSQNSYSQSEVVGNVFLRNDGGKLGAGVGYKERKPNEEELDKESSTTLTFYGDLYFGDLTVGISETEYEENIATFTGQSVGVAYYINPNEKFFLRKDKINRGDVWVLGVGLQPKKLSNQVGLQLSIERGKESFYLGLGINYYFDTAISLQRRDRDYR